ncbi:MAG: hypothetical protein ACRDH6_10335 [Actinomycetota bacterium]
MRALLILIGITLVAAGVSCEQPLSSVNKPAAIEQSEARPGDPPIVWIGGTLEEINDRHLVLREGEGPRIEIGRFVAGATTFWRLTGGAWRELGEDEVAALQVGEATCVETLLDGESFLALRVFLGSGCGPAG